MSRDKEYMMHTIIKYENLEELVPELLPVLKQSIQTDYLEIRRINKAAEKFLKVLERFPQLDAAVYVVFSKYIKKCNHDHESFVFVDEKGHSIAHISGRELQLYGIILPCEEFEISEDYINNTENPA